MTPNHIVVGMYMLVLLIIGEAFRRFNRNSNDFFRAGCKGSWWLIGVTLFMSDISAGTFVANAGLAYQGGWSVVLIYLTTVMCYMINFIFLAAWFRQLRVTTFPEAIRERFGPELELLYSYFNMAALMPLAALQLWSVAIFTEAIFGLSVTVTIVLIGTVMTVYALVGGSWAIMAADFVQGLILFSLTLLIAFLCLWHVGGIPGLFALIEAHGLTESFAPLKAPHAYPDGKFGLLWMASVMLIQIFATNGLYYNATRFFSSKDGRTARKASLLGAGLILIGSGIWFIPPIVGRLLFSAQIERMPMPNPAESAFAVTSLQLLPNGLAGLMLVAIFSASMSSLQGALNVNTAIFVRNALPPLCRFFGRPPIGDSVLIGRIFTLIFGLIMTLLGLYYASKSTEGVWEALFKIHTLFTLPMLVPMFFCLFLRKIPRWGPMAAIAAGLVATLSLNLFSTWRPFEVGIMGVGVTTLALLGSTLFWLHEPACFKQQVEGFFRRMHTPVDFAEEVGEANDHVQYRIIGCFATTLGTLCLLLLLAPNSNPARLGILFIAGFIGGIGLVMLRLSRHLPLGLPAPKGPDRGEAGH